MGKKIGVVSKFETPTEWCFNMVVIPNVNGDVRVYHIVVKLAGLTVCLKLDL